MAEPCGSDMPFTRHQVLEWSGSVLDALSLAVRAALHNTRIPKLTVTGEGEEMEIEVSDNPHDSTPVDATLAPIIITLTRVGSTASCKHTLQACACCWEINSLAFCTVLFMSRLETTLWLMLARRKRAVLPPSSLSLSTTLDTLSA